MKCIVCNSKTKEIFKTKILSKYDVAFYQCTSCEFLQTEKPFWLKEAYQSSMNLTDTGVLDRNLFYSKKTAAILFSFFDTSGSFLDFAGGYGIFTRRMRDLGFDYYWDDPYTENLIAKGFEYKKSKIPDVELVTAFETYEHLEDPLETTEKLFKISDSILFSTAILPDPVPDPPWWYYGTEHGQHISFFRVKTLRKIANIFKCNLYTDGKDLHLLTKKNIIPHIFITNTVYELIKSLNFSGISRLSKSLIAPDKEKDFYFDLRNRIIFQPTKFMSKTHFSDMQEMNQKVFQYLAANPDTIFNIAKNVLKRKTFDDMLELQKRINN
ncbi:methyltransferase domain-containing protein [Candidatus Dojkabacteria bacterium]|nr:methyltransferase domain-containing protein [Candidatus Dojkabacteria bacterium]